MKNKGLIIMGLIVVFTLLFVNIASAELQFDNVKSYDANTKTITITNTFGLGKDIAKLKLNTPLVNVVGYGSVNKIAEFEITNYEDYTNVLQNMKFYEVKYNNREFKRDFEYKFKTYEDVLFNDDSLVCSPDLKNGSICNYEKSTHYEKIEKWIPLEKLDFVKGQVVTIGVFLYTNKGDYGEWIVDAYGKTLTEWAYWTTSLQNGLVDYYSFENSLVSNLSNANWSNSGAVPLDVGKLGYAYNFIDSPKFFIQDKCYNNNSFDFSTSLWIKYGIYSLAGYKGIYTTREGSAKGNALMVYPDVQGTYIGTGYGDEAINISFAPKTNNIWFHIVVTKSVSTQNYTIYVNGTMVNTFLMGGTPAKNFWKTRLMGGYEVTTGNNINGTLDELGFWNRTLSYAEVKDLYNSGNGLTYGDYGGGVTLFAPVVNHNSPVDYYNTTSPQITFNSTIYDINAGGIIQNVSLIIDGVINETNLTTGNNTYIFTKILSEGLHNWTMRAFNNYSNVTDGTIRFFTIDTSIPIITIVYPLNTTYYFDYTLSNNLSTWFNWTSSVFNPDKCWYSLDNGATNITLTCNSNISIATPQGQKTFMASSNDTFGHNSTSRVTATLLYKVSEINQTYNSVTIEGSSENYYANIYLNGAYTINNVYFSYNGTNYSTGYSTIANYTRLEKANLNIPIVTSNQNVTFSWFILLNDGSVIKLQNKTQLINNILIGSCGIYNYAMFNLSLFDEKTQTALNGTIETNLKIYNKQRTITLYNWTSINYDYTTSLCFNVPLNSSSFTFWVDGTIKYYASNENFSSAIEYYNFLNFSLNQNSVFQNVSLYDLNITENPINEFQLTFQDANYQKRSDILIYIYREYVSEGVFKVVELPKTDSNGQTIVHLVRNDVVYNLIAVDINGNIIGTLSNIIAFCKDYTIGQCIINFKGKSNEVELDNFLDDVGLSYDLSYNNVTHLITLNFASSNVTSKNVRMEVISSGMVTNRTLCDTSLNALVGTLTCDVSSVANTSASVNVKIYVNGVQKIQDSLDFDISNWNTAGLMFFAFFLLIVIGMMFIESKEGVIIGTIITFIGMLALGVFKGTGLRISNTAYGVSWVIWLVVVGTILLIKLNSDNK